MAGRGARPWRRAAARRCRGSRPARRTPWGRRGRPRPERARRVGGEARCSGCGGLVVLVELGERHRGPRQRPLDRVEQQVPAPPRSRRAPACLEGRECLGDVGCAGHRTTDTRTDVLFSQGPDVPRTRLRCTCRDRTGRHAHGHAHDPRPDRLRSRHGLHRHRGPARPDHRPRPHPHAGPRRGRALQPRADQHLPRCAWPDGAVQDVLGYRLKTPRRIEWERQADAAITAFQRNGFFVLVNGRQAIELDEEISVADTEDVAFVKLMPLVGG